MPVKLRKLKSGKVQVSTPNMVHSKGTTMAKAKSQERLLNAVEHGWNPKASRKKFRAYAKARGQSGKSSISI